MTTRSAHRTRAALTLAAVALAGAQAPLAAGSTGGETQPAYDLRVEVEPEAGTIHARAEIRSPAATTFSLARDLTIHRVLADGKAVAFAESPSAAKDSLREVTPKTDATPGRLVVEYGGAIRAESYPPTVSQVNHVRPGGGDLASDAGCYPRLKGNTSLTFRLTVDVPAAFVTVTNGRLAGPEARRADRAVTVWESDGPAWDIVLAAAPGLRRTAATTGDGVSVEVYSAALPTEYTDAMKEDIARAVGVIADVLAAPPPSRVVRLVYAPRSGWGYVRRPLIIVSEGSALEQRTQRFGRARDLRYVAHEIAHYWWHQADTATPDDWINEGLAEYTAWLAAGPLAGRAFAAELLAEYRQRSADSATTSAIAETENGSPDREVNRYARPVLILDEGQRRYGSERMTAFLQALYRRFAGSGRATTADFLDEAGVRLGPEARAAFEEALRRRSWTDATQAKYVYSARDAAFLGTWTGSLTQAGSTNEVVLHLVSRDGTLVATLDSPKQGVAGIPVPTVSVAGDELRFGLGAFGVSYRGVLVSDRTAIAGEWTQGGARSPLTLAKAATAPAP